MAGSERQLSDASPLPEMVMHLQARVELLYLERAALQQEVNALRATHPVLCLRPPALSAPMRLLCRLVPRLRRRRDAAIVRNCGLFDPAWYLDTYDDVAAAGSDPLAHFLAYGAAEHRDPGPHFDTGHYLRLYPDIAGNGMNPLVHYLRAGHAEGRSIRPGMADRGQR